MFRVLFKIATFGIAGAIYPALLWAWGYYDDMQVHWGWLVGGGALAYVFWFFIVLMGESKIEDVVKTVMFLPFLAVPAYSPEWGTIGLAPISGMLAVLTMRFGPTIDSRQSVAEMDSAFGQAEADMQDMLEQVEALRAEHDESKATPKTGDDAGSNS